MGPELAFGKIKMADRVTLIRHSELFIDELPSQCIQPVAVIACASGLEHKEAASLSSSGVGVKPGPSSTFPRLACETIAFASETRRKPLATFLFAAAVTTQM